METEPMIAVRDVEASSLFYRKVLAASSGHGGREYEQIVREGVLLLQLHHADAPEHPHLIDPGAPLGNGVLLWFRTREFDAAVARAREVGARFLEEPHVNPLAGHRECMLLDPDGYKVCLAGPYGDTGGASPA